MTDSALEESLRQWGRAKRKLMGIPPQPRSIFGRIQDEGSVGAAIRGEPPDPPEVMLNIALIVARAIRQAIDDHALPYHPYEVLTAHYVLRGPTQRKAERLNITRAVFYQRLNMARAILGPYIMRLSRDADAAFDKTHNL